jgi:hypothetical protein
METVQIQDQKSLGFALLPFDQNEPPSVVIAFAFSRLEGKWYDDSGITGKELFDQFSPL